MTDPILLVTGDTRPTIVVSLANQGASPIDCTGATVTMRLRKTGAGTVLQTITGTLLTGLLGADGVTVDTSVPYNVAGRGGRMSFAWSAGQLDSLIAGDYEGEIRVVFADTSRQTVYETLRFSVRPAFA
jgi:hypothetical protein